MVCKSMGQKVGKELYFGQTSSLDFGSLEILNGVAYTAVYMKLTLEHYLSNVPSITLKPSGNSFHIDSAYKRWLDSIKSYPYWETGKFLT